MHMTYPTADGEFEIDINGNEVKVRKPDLLEYHTPNPVDPYQEYPHCPWDLGIGLIKIKGSLHRCPSCGGHFTVGK